MAGSLENRELEVLLWVAPFLAAGLILVPAPAHSLNALALDGEQATALGVDPAVVRGGAFAAITLLCGAATTATGPTSFIGLVIPHVVRSLVGVNQRCLLAWSVATGAGLLLVTNMVGRLLVHPTRLEAGTVIAFIGAPVLLTLTLTNRTARRGT